jgi:hypothetical protein
MADPRDVVCRQRTTHRELLAHMIEHGSPHQHRSFVRLEPGLTLREARCSADEGHVAVHRNRSNEV